MNTPLSTTARLLFALPFALFGISHFLHAREMASLVPLPGGMYLVVLSGVALVAGSAGIATKILGETAAYGLALLMIIFIGVIHLPGLLHAETQQMAIIGLFKDTALCGGALTWVCIFGAERRAREAAAGSETTGRPATVP